MDAGDALAPLRERVSALHAERDAARAKLAQAKKQLEEAHEEQIAQARSRAQKRRTRIYAAVILATNVLMLGSGAAYLFVHRVSDEALTGRVVSVSGSAPATVGETCRAELSSELGRFNASAVVECAGQRLYGYGTFGQLQCECAGGRAVSCSDPLPILDDGDPMLTLDRRTGRLTLADGNRWRIQIALAGPR